MEEGEKGFKERLEKAGIEIDFEIPYCFIKQAGSMTEFKEKLIWKTMNRYTQYEITQYGDVRLKAHERKPGSFNSATAQHSKKIKAGVIRRYSNRHIKLSCPKTNLQKNFSREAIIKEWNNEA